MRALHLKPCFLFLLITTLFISACGTRGILESDTEWTVLIIVTNYGCITIVDRITLCEDYSTPFGLGYFISSTVTDILSGNTDEEIDSRTLFQYHLISIDGWSPRERGMRDLYWDEFKTGLFHLNYNFRAIFPEFEERTYNVRTLHKIELEKIPEK